jgi:hypothetical protein
MKKKNVKYDPNKPSKRDMKKLSNMITNNNKYLSLPHGQPKTQKLDAQTERNKIYAKRSENPMVIPIKVTDIPAQLARKYEQIDDDEIIFEGELMKYKPGMKH